MPSRHIAHGTCRTQNTKRRLCCLDRSDLLCIALLILNVSRFCPDLSCVVIPCPPCPVLMCPPTPQKPHCTTPIKQHNPTQPAAPAATWDTAGCLSHPNTPLSRCSNITICPRFHLKGTKGSDLHSILPFKDEGEQFALDFTLRGPRGAICTRLYLSATNGSIVHSIQPCRDEGEQFALEAAPRGEQIAFRLSPISAVFQLKPRGPPQGVVSCRKRAGGGTSDKAHAPPLHADTTAQRAVTKQKTLQPRTQKAKSTLKSPHTAYNSATLLPPPPAPNLAPI